MQDLIYIYDKKTFEEIELGEIQVEFNMNFVIDGAKDSTKMQIISFDPNEVEPYTIVYHKATNTWWCAINDKVTRYPHESGFIYTHDMELNGAIDLLSARDLTDCGFNQNTYTISQFIHRLFKLSSFEFVGSNLILDSTLGIDTTRLVNYVKSFENYTLLSALREFLNGYNCSCKMIFTTSGTPKVIDRAILQIIPRTGVKAYTTISIDNFDDVREVKTINSNSFGTQVVTNAQNVIATQYKTYPSVGTIRLSGNGYKITNENAFLRLPSNAYFVNWVKMKFNLTLYVWFSSNNYPLHANYYFTEEQFKESLLNQADALILYVSQTQVDHLKYLINNKYKEMYKLVSLANTVTFYEGNTLNPVSGEIIKGVNVPYIPKFRKPTDVYLTEYQRILTDKATGETLPDVDNNGIWWERGSDKITKFNFFWFPDASHSNACQVFDYKYTDLQDSNRVIARDDYNNIRIELAATTNVKIPNTGWIINYVPMADIKIKTDNQRDKNDMQLYNQTGKLNDAYSVSKLINSYSKEISSDKITRYKKDIAYSDTYSVGQPVKIGNDLYVINDVSLDFYPRESSTIDFSTNDDVEYYIVGEYTLSKQFSTKSLMVSPATNIRDYGIPQNFNVRRKQTYRDYYEMSYAQEDDAEYGTYMPILKSLFFGNSVDLGTRNHTCVMRLWFAQQVGGSLDWYYQLETTRYDMCKMYYEVLDFKDNNIIGYCSQNIYSTFDITRILTNDLIDDINTPISYVDENGCVESFNIYWCDSDQFKQAWDTYLDYYGYDPLDLYNGKDMYNYSIFIPALVYNNAGVYGYDMELSESNYNKDAIEVPVFEYCCQMGDSFDVLVGDTILKVPNEDEVVLYSYGECAESSTTENTTDNNTLTKDNGTGYWKLSNAINFLYNSNGGTNHTYEVRAYTEMSCNPSTKNTSITGNRVNMSANKSYCICKHVLNTKTEQVTKDTIMIIKNIPSNALVDDPLGLFIWKKLVLYLNHYKLK